MKLTNSQYEQLQKALEDALDEESLEELLQFEFGKRLSSISSSRDKFPTTLFKLIQQSEREGWTWKLIVAAHKRIPGNEMLMEFCQQIGLVSAIPSNSVLERMIREENCYQDTVTWRTRMTEIEKQICRVEVYLPNRPRVIFGTGFLVGPEVLITNYHVMQEVIDGRVKPENVVLRFDYKRLNDGVVVNPGAEYRLSEKNWLIDASPMSPVDNMREPKSDMPQFDQLDYALLRIASNPSKESIERKDELRTISRGWIKIHSDPFHFAPQTAMMIMQHPEGKPLQFAIDTNAIIGLNGNNTRVKYRTNTEKGSSGSPCFSINWELVALHHSGDPNFDIEHKPDYNEGIPFSTIFALLKQRQLQSVLE